MEETTKISDFKIENEVCEVAIDLRSKTTSKEEDDDVIKSESHENAGTEAAMPKPDTTTSIISGKEKEILIYPLILI